MMTVNFKNVARIFWIYVPAFTFYTQNLKKNLHIRYFYQQMFVLQFKLYIYTACH